MSFEKPKPLHAHARITRLSGAPLFLVIFLLGLVATVKLSGCANKSPAEAANQEIRLTHSEATKRHPIFSPDGDWIAFTSRYGHNDEKFGVFVVARKGGEPKRLSPDTLDLDVLEWSADGKGIYARGNHGDRLYYVGLDGTMRFESGSEALSGITGVSPDGKSELIIKFVADNRELGLRKAGGPLELLSQTPAWEEAAVFGPGPDEITAVARPSFQAPISSISVWSPQTRSFTALPLPEGLNYDPVWSPDRRFMAFASFHGNQSDVWIYDHRTARTVQLTSGPEDEACPGWSPDGKWLAFCRSSMTSHLFTGEPGAAKRRQLTDGAAFDYSPMVSPDGQWVAFMRRLPVDSASKRGPVLCVMPVAGGHVQELDLADVTLSGKGMDAISWSRDSRELAFQGNEGSGKMDVYRIGRDGQGLARVTVGPGDELAPSWSPDGRFISYTQAGGGQTQVMVVPANGGLPVTVSDPGSTSEGGAWAPDSDRLAYITYRSDGSFEVWTSSRTHPERRVRVVRDRELVFPMYWSRDGQELILSRRQENSWHFYSVPAQGGPETAIAREVPITGGRAFYYELLPAGEKHRDLFYPAGVFVFGDGKSAADLYLTRVGDVLRDRASAPRAPSLSSILLAARAE